MKIVLLVLGVMFAGCVSTRFKPYKTEHIHLSRITRDAVKIYDGDVQAIVVCGGYLIGSIQASGGKWATSDRIQQKALNEAAVKGATHALYTTSRYTEVQVTQDTASTSCSTYGDHTSCQTAITPGLKGTREDAYYILIRLSKENWGCLPEALRP